MTIELFTICTEIRVSEIDFSSVSLIHQEKVRHWRTFSFPSLHSSSDSPKLTQWEHGLLRVRPGFPALNNHVTLLYVSPS